MACLIRLRQRFDRRCAQRDARLRDAA